MEWPMMLAVDTLRVRVQDELGLVGESELHRLIIGLDTPTTPAGVLLMEAIQRNGWLFSLLIGACALGLAVFVLVRKPVVVQAVGNAAGAVVQRVKEATEPFIHRKGPKTRRARAYLEVIQGDGAHTRPIGLWSENTRIGRDETWANVVFNDPTVSRLHTKIVQEQDSAFRIYDEGSTGGTYVNDEEVLMGGRWLKDGDTIEIGRIQLQFVLKEAPDDALKPETEPFLTRTGDARTSTEPFLPRGAKSSNGHSNKVSEKE
jgi:hypothetical protein